MWTIRGSSVGEVLDALAVRLRRAKVDVDESGALVNVPEAALTLQLDFGTHKAASNFTGLYSVGRLLSLLRLLREGGFRPVVQLLNCDAFERHRVTTLALPEYLQRVSIPLLDDGGEEWRSEPDSGRHSYRGDAFAPFRGRYWLPLVPLQSSPIAEAQSELELAEVVNWETSRIMSRAVAALQEVGIPPKYVAEDLTRMAFSVANELLSNALRHSGSNEVVMALVASRDNRLPDRHHPHGQQLRRDYDRLELLVLDFGVGIPARVSEYLGGERVHKETHAYRSFVPWRADFAMMRDRETTLLSSLFRGEVLIRRGRRSEGLGDIGQEATRFGGVINVHSGRSEANLAGVPSGHLVAAQRREKDRPTYFLPGVIFSMAVPSLNLELTTLRKHMVKRVPAPAALRGVDYVAQDLLQEPRPAPMRRKAEAAVAKLLQAFRQPESRGRILTIDVSSAVQSQTDSIDDLIQELAKASITFGEKGHGTGLKDVLCRRVVLIGISGGMLRALRERNANAFLQLENEFLLCLDEYDRPNILGLPQIETDGYDVESLLRMALMRGRVRRDDCRSERAIRLFAAAQKILRPHSEDVLHLDDDGNLVARDVFGAQRAERRAALAELNHYRVSSPDDEEPKLFGHQPHEFAYELRNGIVVSWIWDFDSFWAEGRRLQAVSGLLSRDTRGALLDTLVAFMGNGDRLASALQKRVGAPNLVLLDPHDQSLWATASVSGNCALVVDALYPGDRDRGYVRDAADFLKRAERSTLCAVIAVVDTEGTITRKTSEPPVRTITCEAPERLKVPTVVKDFPLFVRVLQRGDKFRSTRSPVLREEVDDTAGVPRGIRYSQEELASDFWENVSQLGVLTPYRQGREDRNVIFYENNEALLRHPRTRRYVKELLSHLIRGELRSRVDVILHPSHAVGALLADWAVSVCPGAMAFSLPQRKYGGEIRPTYEDDRTLSALASGISRKAGRPAQVLIVDDSVLTGSSLFRMLGIAGQAGAEPVGIFVLLNRMPAEISAALELLPIRFRYLYRLHMPIISAENAPGAQLERLNRWIAAQSSSPLARRWAQRLVLQSRSASTAKSEGSEAASGVTRYVQTLWSELPPGLEVVDEEGRKFANRMMDREALRQQAPSLRSETAGELDHILRELILHRDPNILSFEGRMAIAYNFLPSLLHHRPWWWLLDALRDAGLKREHVGAIAFVRSILHITAFADYLEHPENFQLFERFCVTTVEKFLSSEERSGAARKLLADALMALGIIGSHHLIQLCGPLIDTFPREDQEREPSAFEVLEVLSWGLARLNHRKGGGHKLHLIAELQPTRADVWTHDEMYRAILLLSLFAPTPGDPDSSGSDSELEADDWFLQLREALKIPIRADKMERSVDACIRSPKKNEVMAFLERAPGYTCTLAMAIETCRADGVFVYARRVESEPYTLQVFQTRQPTATSAFTRSAELSDETLPDWVRNRMAERQVVYAGEGELAQIFAQFSAEECNYGAVLGSPVHAQEGGLQYFAFLTFRHPACGSDVVLEGYYQWLRVERVLRRVLPEIHRRHLGAPASWTTLIRSGGTLHPSARKRAGEDDRTWRRRASLGVALSNMGLGDHIRHVVGMSWVPVQTMARLEANLGRHVLDLSKALTDIRQPYVETANPFLGESGLELPLTLQRLPLSGGKRRQLFTIYSAVMDYVFLEAIKNALTYCETYVNVMLSQPSQSEVENLINDSFLFPGSADGLKKIWVRLDVVNDIDLDRQSTPDDAVKSIGLAACRAAASSVGGSFWAVTDVEERTWSSVLMLPAYEVPLELAERLNGKI